MKLNSPKKLTWNISTLLVVIGIVFHWILNVNFITPYAVIIMLIGYLILWLGTFLKGF